MIRKVYTNLSTRALSPKVCLPTRVSVSSSLQLPTRSFPNLTVVPLGQSCIFPITTRPIVSQCGFRIDVYPSKLNKLEMAHVIADTVSLLDEIVSFTKTKKKLDRRRQTDKKKKKRATHPTPSTTASCNNKIDQSSHNNKEYQYNINTAIKTKDKCSARKSY